MENNDNMSGCVGIQMNPNVQITGLQATTDQRLSAIVQYARGVLTRLRVNTVDQAIGDLIKMVGERDPPAALRLAELADSTINIYETLKSIATTFVYSVDSYLPEDVSNITKSTLDALLHYDTFTILNSIQYSVNKEPVVVQTAVHPIWYAIQRVQVNSLDSLKKELPSLMNQGIENFLSKMLPQNVEIQDSVATMNVGNVGKPNLDTVNSFINDVRQQQTDMFSVPSPAGVLPRPSGFSEGAEMCNVGFEDADIGGDFGNVGFEETDMYNVGFEDKDVADNADETTTNNFDQYLATPESHYDMPSLENSNDSI